MFSPVTVWKIVLYHTVNECADECAGQDENHRKETSTNHDENRPGTSPDERPAQPKKQSANPVAVRTRFFIGDDNWLAFDVLDLLALDYLDSGKPDGNRRPDDSVHMERLEMEHFVNAVPRNGFAFNEYYPKNKPDK